MTGTDQHRRLREQLGAYALGHLDAHEEHALRAHVDGCESCRAELDSIAPAVAGLARVDLARLAGEPTPASDLGDRIRVAVSAEHTMLRRRGRSWVLAAAAAVLVVALGGFVVGRSSSPEPPKGPSEVIDLQPLAGSEIEVEEATLIPHTWGVEVRFAANGFEDGAVYDALVRSRDGTMRPAGQFLGEGATAVVCQMQSAAARADSAVFLVTEADGGDVVLRADLG